MIFRKYGYAWITLSFFVGSFLLHWYFGWQSYVADASEHGQIPQRAEYLDQMLRDTFENWQSEFLQLLWQVCGLAYFLYAGSPASKENDDRVEAKIDALLIMNGEVGLEIMEKLDRHFLRTGGHPEPHGHQELDDILGTLRQKGEAPA
jgi:hypothetical protein